jgi:hypothetical protein
MSKTYSSDSPVSVGFFQPVADLFAKLRSQRSCPALSDIEFIELSDFQSHSAARLAGFTL